jgi:3-methyladenine DNA glycosylase AlkD
MSASKVLIALKSQSSARHAYEQQRFYKTAAGEYGEGDVFLGISVPKTRKIAGENSDLTFSELEKLTKSDFHEVRLCALVILCNRYKKSRNLKEKKSIFDFYMKQVLSGRVNNWDLVDVSAPTIGQYLLETKNPMPMLRKLSKSKDLWERRTAMIFTFALLRAGELSPTYEIAERLIKDNHDLIHKAVGWMLREMGKRDPALLRAFLRNHSKVMPRTMLRYSIEKLPEQERKMWLVQSKKIA